MSDWEVVQKPESDWAVVSPEEDEAGGPESFLHPDKFKPTPKPGSRKFENTGPIEQVRRDLDPRQHPTDVGELLAGQPLSTADRYTGGALSSALRLDRDVLSKNPIARAVDEIPVLGELIGKHGGETADRSLRSIESYRAENPTLSMYTDAPGYMAGAPRAIAAGVERALPQVVNPLAQAARATVASGLASGGTAGVESAMRGDEPMEVLREAGRGYVGGTAIGAPLSTGAALLRGGANTVLRSKGAKAREYLDARGQPLTAPDTSDSAIGAAAQRADEAVKARLGQYKGEVASGPYTEALDAIPQRAADQAVNVTPIYRDLALAANDPANLQVADKLNMLVNMLGDRPIMTQQELNGLRQSLSRIAGVGETNAAKMAPLRRAYEGVKALVDQGPYAEPNRRFTEGMRDFGESLDMAGLRSTSSPDEPIAGNFRVKAQRAGQNTVTAGGDTESLDIEAFKAKHPELAEAIDAPEVLRRQGDLQFHLGAPHHGGLIERLAAPAGIGAYAAASALGHGLKGLAAIPLYLGMQNATPLAGRVLYDPAQTAQLAAQMLLGQTPAIAAPGREVLQEGR